MCCLYECYIAFLEAKKEHYKYGESKTALILYRLFWGQKERKRSRKNLCRELSCQKCGELAWPDPKITTPKSKKATIVDRLPKTRSGKILRGTIQTSMIRRF